MSTLPVLEKDIVVNRVKKSSLRDNPLDAIGQIIYADGSSQTMEAAMANPVKWVRYE